MLIYQKAAESSALDYHRTNDGPEVKTIQERSAAHGLAEEWSHARAPLEGTHEKDK